MKSIKPGRGPSAMGAMGSVVAAIFGVVWTMSAASMGAPPFFMMFGVLFVILGIVQGVYHYKNATGKNRFSEFDITEEGEERDPFEDLLGKKEVISSEENKIDSDKMRFCPYCGTGLGEHFEYCPKCGKRLP